MRRTLIRIAANSKSLIHAIGFCVWLLTACTSEQLRILLALIAAGLPCLRPETAEDRVPGDVNKHPIRCELIEAAQVLRGPVISWTRGGRAPETTVRMWILTAVSVSALGCATLTEDAMTPVAFSFSDGANGNCNLSNKRGAWQTTMPATVSVRKSDDALKYDCESDDGRKAFGSIPSEMGGKIVASAIFLDLGITDAITDKHRQYPASFVIPLPKAESKPEPEPPTP